jgi:hypothetical protein
VEVADGAGLLGVGDAANGPGAILVPTEGFSGAVWPTGGDGALAVLKR